MNIKLDIAKQITIEVRKGDSLNIDFSFNDENNTAITMSHKEVKWQFRKGSKTGELLLEITHNNNGGWINTNTFKPNVIIDLPTGVHYSDFQIKDGDRITTYFEAKVIVNQDVSF